DRAEVAEPEDLATELALAAREDDVVGLDRAVERLPVVALGELRRGHGLGGIPLVGEQLEPERLEAGPRRSGAGLVAGEDRGRALLLHEADALVDLVDDGDRGRERRLAVLRRVAVRAQDALDARAS